jgi:putative IMPACT (imprinted ancient) family translation regulator
MLEVLTRRGISDVAAVVTRWFGGTLLGAGGLVRAYGDAVGLGLDAAGVQQRTLRHLMTVRVAPGDAGALDHRLRALGEVTGVAYGAEAVFTVAVADSEAFANDVAQASGGHARIARGGTVWVDL